MLHRDLKSTPPDNAHKTLPSPTFSRIALIDSSTNEADSPTYSKELFELGVPVLGLCYGAQLMMHVLGGKVERADVREYGKTEVLIDKTQSKIFADVSPKTVCWMSHFDYISHVAPGFEIYTT